MTTGTLLFASLVNSGWAERLVILRSMISHDIGLLGSTSVAAAQTALVAYSMPGVRVLERVRVSYQDNSVVTHTCSCIRLIMVVCRYVVPKVSKWIIECSLACAKLVLGVLRGLGLFAYAVVGGVWNGGCTFVGAQLVLAQTLMRVTFTLLRGVLLLVNRVSNMWWGVLFHYCPDVLILTQSESWWAPFYGSCQQQLRHFLSLSVEVSIHRFKRRDRMRSTFTQSSPLPVSGYLHNPHMEMARLRKSASNMIDKWINESGRRIYSWSSSRADAGSKLQNDTGHDRWRSYYDSKDMGQRPRNDSCTADHVVKMVDVDWYVAEWEFAEILFTGSPIAMYTYNLDSVYYTGSEGVNVLRGDQFTSSCAGGAQYTHKLWNWNRDLVVFVRPCGGVVFANVETIAMPGPKDNDYGRCVVALIPICSVALDGQWLMQALLSKEDQRIKHVSGVKEAPGMFSLHNGRTYSLFVEPASFYSFPSQDWANLLAASKTHNNLSVSTIQRFTGKEGEYALRRALSEIAICTNPVNYANLLGSRPRHFTLLYTDLPDEAKLSGTIISKPVLDTAIMPAENEAADLSAVSGRSEEIRCADIPVPADFYAWSAEFRAHMVRAVGPLIPLNPNEILESMRGDKYKKMFAASEWPYVEGQRAYLARNTFLKKETYGEIKAPRDIKVVPPEIVIALTAFIAPLSHKLSEVCPWYAFGRPPHEVAELVHAVCAGQETVYTTDFSRFDGTQGEFLSTECAKDLEAFYAACVEWLKTLAALEKAHINVIHKTRFKRAFTTLFQMLTGTAWTSNRNTIINARANFIALRASGVESDAAWTGLGLYGGDDGITAYPDYVKAELVMRQLGLRMKAKACHAGETVDFLARIYLDPFTHTRSHHDIARAMSKFHISATDIANSTIAEMRWRKAVSLWVTDSKTPVMGMIAKYVLTHTASGIWRETWKDEQHQLGLVHDEAVLSTTIMERWPDPIFPGPTQLEADGALGSFLDDYGITRDDYDIWEAKLLASPDVMSWPEPLAFKDMVTSAGIAAVVDGQVSGDPAVEQTRAYCINFIRKDCPLKKLCPDVHTKGCRAFTWESCTREKCPYPHIAVGQVCSRQEGEEQDNRSAKNKVKCSTVSTTRTTTRSDKPSWRQEKSSSSNGNSSTNPHGTTPGHAGRKRNGQEGPKISPGQ